MKTQYEALYNQLVHSCDQMLSILDKANTAIETEKISEEVLLSGTIAPDMFHFTKQVQVFADLVQGSVCRLSGILKPKVIDDEVSISDLIARVEMTKVFIQSIDITTVTGEGKKIHLPWMPEGKCFDGAEYAEKFILQNTFFHLSMTYAILRALGGEIGKMDFLAGIQMEDIV